MGNTLIDFHQGRSDNEKDDIGISAISDFLTLKLGRDVSHEYIQKEFIEKWFAIMPLRKKFLKEFPIEEFLDPFLRGLELNFTYEEKVKLMILFDSGYQQDLVTAPDLHNLLRSLKNKYKIGVISNSPSFPEVNINHFKHLELDQFIDHYIFSYSLTIAKPQTAIFKKATELFDTAPEQCVMVGDSLVADIEGAQRLKMKTIWLNSKGESSSLPITPDLEIKFLSELSNALL
jgi:HAD superfamily hydrolase (TIGR01509 family)